MTNEPQPEQPIEFAPLGALVEALGLFIGAFTGLLGAGAPTAELMRQQAAQGVRSQLLDVASAMEARRRGELTQVEWLSTLSRIGFSDRAIEVFEALAPVLLDAGTATELLRRGEVDEEEYGKVLSRLGFDGESVARLAALREVLPPLQDVLRWAVREVFTPEIRTAFQLDEDFPDDVLPFARRVGFSDENTRNAWAAHWELPSIRLLFEMLHRQPETGVTEDDVDTTLRALDVMPRWRGPIKAIAFRPFNRVDIRRMHRLGVIADDQLVQAYRDLGFDTDRAEAQAEFARRLNEVEDDDALEPFRSSIRSRVQSLFLRGALGEQALREAFADLGHTPEEVDAFVAESALIRDTDRAEDVRQSVKRLFVRGFWDEAMVAETLRDAGFEQDDIGNLLTTWSLDRTLREESAEERAERDLTKGDILGAFGDSLLERSETAGMLTDIGFDVAEADVLLDRIELRRSQETRQRVERGTRVLFIAGRLTAAEASGRLGGADIPQARIDVLIAQWGDEVEARTPELSVAQIQQALRGGFMETDDAAQRLDAMGYVMEDRDILIQLAKGTTG